MRTLGQPTEILGQAEVVEMPQIPTVSRDVTDDEFLANSEAAEADYLVSEDKDLLILTEYEGVKIMDTATFLTLLEQEHGEGEGWRLWQPHVPIIRITGPCLHLRGTNSPYRSPGALSPLF